ncbi:MAG: Tfp pilus assembly protein FimT/FimU [Gemmatimonadaceae bacterium]
MRYRVPSGVTLAELLVVIVILGITAGITGLAFARSPARDRVVSAVPQSITDARAEALHTGHTVSITISVQGTALAATAFPDGSVVADSALGVDYFTGREKSRAR